MKTHLEGYVCVGSGWQEKERESWKDHNLILSWMVAYTFGGNLRVETKSQLP